MKKAVIKILSAVCSLGIALSLFSCEKTTAETETSAELYYTVSFNTEGGSPVESMKIQEGKTIHRPDDPVRDNYVFCRWIYNEVEWVFHETTVKQDMTLNAYWIEADKFFEIEPTADSGELYILGIRRQESLDSLKVPSIINGKTVVAIFDNAFENIHDAHTQHLILPESITSIGSEAFKNISKVKITINGTITQLGEGAFERCSTLTEIKLGKGIEIIPFTAFSDCVSIEHMDIPDGVTKIDENAFAGCSSLRTVILPETLTSIENSAFDDCKALKTVFFKGTPEQFDNIAIDELNDDIIDATVYFYSEQQPAEEGNFWHYDKNNSPVIW